MAELCWKGHYLHYLFAQNWSLCQHSYLSESPCTSPITNPGGFLTLLFSSTPSNQHHWVWGAELHLSPSEHPITRGLAGKLRAGKWQLEKLSEREDSAPSKLKEIPQESQLLIKNLGKKGENRHLMKSQSRQEHKDWEACSQKSQLRKKTAVISQAEGKPSLQGQLLVF